MPLTEEEILEVANLVHDLCGVDLDASKSYLIEGRLGGLLAKAGASSYSDLVRRARRGDDGALRNQIVDAITTNETLFFRDKSLFDALAHKVLPELFDAKEHASIPRRVRIWSAACSTGQEPYSIAMTLCELLPDVHSWDIQILATDISDAAVSRASRGWYASFEMERGVDERLRDKYFEPRERGWRVRDEVRALVGFRQWNLLDPFGPLGMFDIILCRNVAIYFTPVVREQLFRRMAGALTRDGYLFVGGQESLTDLGPEFSPEHHCRASVYRPNLPAAARRAVGV